MRLPDWDIRLAAYINQNRLVPFAWGTHDCLTFTNGAHRAMTGVGFADDVVGASTTRNNAIRQFLRAKTLAGAADGFDLMDTRLNRHNGAPARGYLVGRRVSTTVTGVALGVCVGRNVAFVGISGLEFGPSAPGDAIWEVA